MWTLSSVATSHSLYSQALKHLSPVINNVDMNHDWIMTVSWLLSLYCRLSHIFPSLWSDTFAYTSNSHLMLKVKKKKKELLFLKDFSSIMFPIMDCSMNTRHCLASWTVYQCWHKSRWPAGLGPTQWQCTLGGKNCSIGWKYSSCYLLLIAL